MRYIPATIKERLLSTQQTLYANADPWMETALLRQKLPIQKKEHWQESIVDTVACTYSSVAVRKQSVLRPADVAYVAYVYNSTLYVKQATIRYPIRHMQWTLVEEIPNVSMCALDFDGQFKRTTSPAVSELIVEFETDETPWLFYMTTSNELLCGLLGGPYESFANNVVSFDVIRGVVSADGMTDQGIVAFYVVNGTVYYKQLLDGVWDGPYTVPIGPTDAVHIRVERTFDYRLVIQTKDSTGALHETFTKTYVSGWANMEQIWSSISNVTIADYPVQYEYGYSDEAIYADLDAFVDGLWNEDQFILYADNNVPVWAEDPENPGVFRWDYGFKCNVVWDYRITNIAPNVQSFLITDSESNLFGSVAVTYVGVYDSNKRLYEVEFQNFNNAVGLCTLAYVPGTLQGEAGQTLLASSVQFTPANLDPFYVPPPLPVSIENVIDWSVNP